ncbi:aldehyde ferredoxin oxidoreductase N-terminal domain-containing protein [Aromatoleum diolicum]|uniref:Aldehyde ferredoxin oxidoreductase N-terminal domain-containing protein n=1 Tax=Aromatoleum diolicum TaxID=75796 RepID=A0ABX1Q9W5_9RHOO|nr:aldehyde ferredoxin oxidoreductase N-terminal domain-containing protein [Aromatoleum diolicum]NMG74221.1 hypothetical protein [Aromatoleum diolicum]
MSRRYSETIGGYCNRLLRVDLTSGLCSVTPLAEEAVLRKYIGGVGLGMRLLLDEIRPGMKATDTDSPLIMLAGPLAGTSAPSSSNVTVVALDHNSPGGAAAGSAGGYWAAYLKHAGYDGLVVTGRAREPVFLSIEDEKVAIRDASAFWGLDTRDTERLIKRSLFEHSKFSVACIGPAGEAMLPGASIRNDRNHGVHIGGVGAVMGSKRLKAIAVYGSRPVPLASPVKFDDVTLVWSRSVSTESDSFGSAIDRATELLGHVPESESQVLMGRQLAKASLAVAFRDQLATAAADSWTVVPKGCFNCGTVCAYDCHVNEGEFARASASICGCYESVGDVAEILGITDPSAAIAVIDYFHALGIDSALASTVMARAFQLFDSGIVTLDDTNGFELASGSVDSLRELLDQIVEGYGFGGEVLRKSLTEIARISFAARNLCAESTDCGTTEVGGRVGPEREPPKPDCPKSNAVLLQKGSGGEWGDLGLRPAHRMASKDSVTGIRSTPRPHSQHLWANCLGVCLSACRGVDGAMSFSAQAVAHATGWEDFSANEAHSIEEMVASLHRRVVLERAGGQRRNRQLLGVDRSAG